VADNASSAGVVLGSRPQPLSAVDLRLTGVNLRRNGELFGTGAGGAVMGNPLLALAWIANVLGKRGIALEPGHVVMPGSCTAACPVGPGDVVSASFAGLGTVTARFGAAG
jgi:2-keto-4-pentenoate hydratase